MSFSFLFVLVMLYLVTTEGDLVDNQIKIFSLISFETKSDYSLIQIFLPSLISDYLTSLPRRLDNLICLSIADHELVKNYLVKLTRIDYQICRIINLIRFKNFALYCLKHKEIYLLFYLLLLSLQS